MPKQVSKRVRLLPLLDACSGLEKPLDATSLLLGLCLEKSIRGYFRVPEGQVAVSYRTVERGPCVPMPGSAKGAVLYKLGPLADRTIGYLGLERVQMQGIRDAGSVTADAFQSGGLKVLDDGLRAIEVDYAVIQRDAPRPHSMVVFGMYHLQEGEVLPVSALIHAEDVLVSAQDLEKLRASVAHLNVHDKWGHREAAPSVFLAYRASQEPYDPEAICKMLISEDKHKVFNRAIALAVARLIKVDVKKGTEDDMAVEKISCNETGKDYGDPTLSKRMSLLLLATDCWIHDKPLHDEMKERLGPVRNGGQKRWLLGEADREKLDLRVVECEQREWEAIRGRLYMPLKLKAYLADLGFSPSQVEDLYRVITQTKAGGRHVATEREAAQSDAAAEPSRIRHRSRKRPPSPA